MLKLIMSFPFLFALLFASNSFSADLSKFCFLDNNQILVFTPIYQSFDARAEIRDLNSGAVLKKFKNRISRGNVMCSGKNILYWANTYSTPFRLSFVNDEVIYERLDPIFYQLYWEQAFIFNQDAFEKGIVYSIMGDWAYSSNGTFNYYQYDLNNMRLYRSFEIPVANPTYSNVRYFTGTNESKFSDGLLFTIVDFNAGSGKVSVRIQNEYSGQILLNAKLRPSEAFADQYYGTPGVLFLPKESRFILVTEKELHFWAYANGQATLTKRMKIDLAPGPKNLRLSDDKKFVIISSGGQVKFLSTEDWRVLYATEACQTYKTASTGHIFFSPDRKWIGVNFYDCSQVINRKDLGI